MSTQGEDIARRYEAAHVAEHPFFVRLRGRPVDLSSLWLLMANLREGISGHFVGWLARTIARTEDRRIACFLAKQLNDELGNGDPRQIHSVLLDRFVEGLSRWRPARVSDVLLDPGRRLAHSGAMPFFAANPNEALGALITGEIFAKKMDQCLGDEVRRQSLLDDDSLTWLRIHEVLEVEHADEVTELAALLPRSDAALAAAECGARHQWEALWRFLLDVDAACTGLEAVEG